MSTLYFPQLAVGAVAQYPVTRQWSKAIAFYSGSGSLLVFYICRPHR